MQKLCFSCTEQACEAQREMGGNKGTILMILDFSSNFCSFLRLCPSTCLCRKYSKQEPLDIKYSSFDQPPVFCTQ